MFIATIRLKIFTRISTGLIWWQKFIENLIDLLYLFQIISFQYQKVHYRPILQTSDLLF